MVDDFVSVLEAFLNTKRVKFRISDNWAKCPPLEAGGKSLDEYLQKVCHQCLGFFFFPSVLTVQ